MADKRKNPDEALSLIVALFEKLGASGHEEFKRLKEMAGEEERETNGKS